MARDETRGTKRKCQNEDCALPFYDLNRAEYACPNCGTAFDVRVLERLPPPIRLVHKPMRANFVAAPVRAPVEPVPDEEVEPIAVSEDALEETENEQGADPILEPEDEDDGIVETPTPKGRIED